MKIASFNIRRMGPSKQYEDNQEGDEDAFSREPFILRHAILQNVMILGDFNADGAYVSKKKMKAIRIRSDPDFHWLIGDDVDTTVIQSNDHTYDRIVVYKDDMLQAVVPKSAKPFNFQEAYKLSEEMALDISDHYPVEVSLKKKSAEKTSGKTKTKKQANKAKPKK